MAEDDKQGAQDKPLPERKMRGWSPSVRGGYQPSDGHGGGPPTGGSGAKKPSHD